VIWSAASDPRVVGHCPHWLLALHCSVFKKRSPEGRVVETQLVGATRTPLVPRDRDGPGPCEVVVSKPALGPDRERSPASGARGKTSEPARASQILGVSPGFGTPFGQCCL